MYLVKYSQANLEQFPTRRGEAVVRSFHSSNTRVMHWVCSRESHRNGGFHYHMALKLNRRRRRWLCSKKFLKEQHSISVHFSDLHYNYYSAWKYVTKEDEHVLDSNDHPDLWNYKAPKTSTVCSERKKSRVSRKSDDEQTESDDDLHEDSSEAAEKKSADEKERKSKKRKKRLTPFELSEIIVEKGIRTRTELLAFANKQK